MAIARLESDFSMRSAVRASEEGVSLDDKNNEVRREVAAVCENNRCCKALKVSSWMLGDQCDRRFQRGGQHCDPDMIVQEQLYDSILETFIKLQM